MGPAAKEDFSHGTETLAKGLPIDLPEARLSNPLKARGPRAAQSINETDNGNLAGVGVDELCVMCVHYGALILH